MANGGDERDGGVCSPERVLEAGLAAHFGRAVRIVAMQYEKLAQSSHAIDRLQVSLDSGERLPVIFKRLQPGEKPHGNEREILIYRELLAGGRFGAPLLYESVYDEAASRYWLFLEDVGRHTLEHGDTEEWLAACRWLGELHGSYMGRADELGTLGGLGEQGGDFYWAKAEEARRNLRCAGDEGALDRFDALLRSFDPVVAHLNRQPRTLVHGDIFSHNLMLGEDGRIRAIDWEAAAIGLPEWDLVGLLSGWPAAYKRRFVRTYLEAVAYRTGAPIDAAAIARTLERYRLVKDLWYLSWSVSWCTDPIFVAERLDRMEAGWSGLRAGATDG